MTRKSILLMFALATLIALPAWATGGGRGNCTDVPLLLIVAPQTPGQGGIAGDGLSIYNNPNDPAFNGGTQYVDGVGGVYVKFQVCNGTNDFILNLRSTKSPVRYVNLDFSVQLAPADTANGAVDLTGQQTRQQGQQINELANAVLYSNGQFVTCSGMSLNPLSPTVSGGNAWYKPTTIYDPVVADCNGGTGPDLANQPINTSPVQVQQVNACTWTVSPMLDSIGSWYRIGVAETVKTGGTQASGRRAVNTRCRSATKSKSSIARHRLLLALLWDSDVGDAN
jgi:hypothetical protein